MIWHAGLPAERDGDEIFETPNHRLGSLLAKAGWNGPMLARLVNQLGAENGISLSYHRSSVTRWLSGTRPRPRSPISWPRHSLEF
jgi:hypothetical protein